MGKIAKTNRGFRFLAAVVVVSTITTSLAGCQRTTPPSPEVARANKQALAELIDQAVAVGLGTDQDWKIMKTCSGSGECYEDNNYYASFNAAKTGFVFAGQKAFCESAFGFARELQPEVVSQNTVDSTVKDLESGLNTCLGSPNQMFEMWSTHPSQQVGHRWRMNLQSESGKESIQLYIF
jgi:hypothetical protein